jgi:hypothetical protein
LKQEFNTGLQGDRPAPKPLSHEDMLIPSASFFHFTELAVNNESHCTLCKSPKQTNRARIAMGMIYNRPQDLFE